VRLQRTAAIVLFATVCLPAYADDQALGNLIASLKKHSGASPSPVSLTAVDAKDDRHLSLRFTLTNVSGKPLQIDPASLPWGNTYSIRWAAVTRDGHVLPVGYPIDDPGPGESVSLQPGQSLTGTYHLDWMLEQSAAPRNTDIAVLWLYSFPAGPVLGRDPRPFCTGVTVVHVP
jgi:hypothetical protein